MFTKERTTPEPGSIPDLLGMFEREVRFYREVAQDVGVRVPACYEATATDRGWLLRLEDLSAWEDGGDPVHVAQTLSELHQRWAGVADRRWPWLDREGAAAAEIGAVYDRVWAVMRSRDDLTAGLHSMGDLFVGKVEGLERREASFGQRTLIHGDASLRNTRTGPDGEIALLDWEDVRIASGAIDVTWLLVSSVQPDGWDDVRAAYGASDDDLRMAFPYAITQGILTMADHEPGSVDAAGWASRLESACEWVQ